MLSEEDTTYRLNNRTVNQTALVQTLNSKPDLLFVKLEDVILENNDTVLDLTKCTELIELSIVDTDVRQLPDITGCTNLKEIRINVAKTRDYTMAIPISINSTSSLARLTALNLSSCNLEGSIPTWIGSLPKLSFLDLSNNKLSGDIPSTIRNLDLLYRLNLSHNRLSGRLNHIRSLRHISTLYLNDNQFSGKIPALLLKVGTYNYSKEIRLHNNQFQKQTLPAKLKVGTTLSVDPCITVHPNDADSWGSHIHDDGHISMTKFD